jgi:hypothetical protein
MLMGEWGVVFGRNELELTRCNRNQWTAMFASRSTNIASDLPLWAVQFDKKPGVNTVDTFMGGWTKAAAKQYNLGTYTP